MVTLCDTEGNLMKKLKAELFAFLKENLKIKAYRGQGHISMGGPQDGESEPGPIHIQLLLDDQIISQAKVENW